MPEPRFFAPAADAAGAIVALPDDEAAHLVRVLRLKAGDAVRVFNGRGHEWGAQVREAGKHQVTVRLGESRAAAPESRIAIALAMAVLKADKMDNVVRDAVMLGVTAIWPLITERTEVASSVIERSGRIARWQRIAVSSAKQCGRAVVPIIRDAARLEEALGLSSAVEGATSAVARALADGRSLGEGWSVPAALRLMLVEPRSGAETTRTLQQLSQAPVVELFVGPEGGWTGGEVQAAAAAGAMLVTLGGQTLRADAVPLVAITALRVLWGDL